uniref:Uncharacterized protein n=1 Tax=Kalanchoe fedtschenkoi TaxID=63787 RepID=A0A7N0TV48_KALFE
MRFGVGRGSQAGNSGQGRGGAWLLRAGRVSATTAPYLRLLNGDRRRVDLAVFWPDMTRGFEVRRGEADLSRSWLLARIRGWKGGLSARVGMKGEGGEENVGKGRGWATAALSSAATAKVLKKKIYFKKE